MLLEVDGELRRQVNFADFRRRLARLASLAVLMVLADTPPERLDAERRCGGGQHVIDQLVRAIDVAAGADLYLERAERVVDRRGSRGVLCLRHY